MGEDDGPFYVEFALEGLCVCACVSKKATETASFLASQDPSQAPRKEGGKRRGGWQR